MDSLRYIYFLKDVRTIEVIPNIPDTTVTDNPVNEVDVDPTTATYILLNLLLLFFNDFPISFFFSFNA